MFYVEFFTEIFLLNHLPDFPENCQVDYVLFESATTLKEAIIREWNMLQKHDIDDLSAFLLNYITQKKR